MKDIESKECMGSFFVFTTGEFPELSLEELKGAMGALHIPGEILDISPQVIQVSAEGSLEGWEALVGRVGYVFGAYQTLFPVRALTRAFNEMVLKENDVHFDSLYDAMLPHSGEFIRWLPRDMRIGIEAVRVQGSFPRIGRTILKKMLGKLIVDNGGVIGLDDPDITIKVIMSRSIYIGKQLAASDRKEMTMRRNQHRPFSMPITLSPNSSRALLNMAEMKSGEKIHDPFCGTGGILLEAADLGARVFGSDIDERMIRGTEENFNFLNQEFEQLSVFDIEDSSASFPPMDAVVTDPPYGRSTSTNREGLDELYERMFRAIGDILAEGGRCALILPSLGYLSLLPDNLILKSAVSSRVHRSLVRYFISLVKKD